MSYILAKDHDLLRFRAPSQFNDIVKNLAEKYATGLADVETLFRERSSNGVIANKLILEHLHPTVLGYFLLSEAYLDEIIKLGHLEAPQEFYSRQKALVDVPVTKVDSYYGDYMITNLMNDFPFTHEPRKEEMSMPMPESQKFEREALVKRIQQQSWIRVQQELLVQYQQAKDVKEAAKIASNISTAMVDDHQAAYIAGQLYQRLEDWQLAAFHHAKAVSQQANNVQYLLALAQDYYYLGELTQSLSLLQKALTLVDQSSSQYQQIQQYISGTRRAMNLKSMNDDE